MKIGLILVLMSLCLLVVAAPCLAAISYTPLISSTDFAGVTTDTLTTAVGIITVLLVIVGLGILVKVLGR